MIYDVVKFHWEKQIMCRSL